MSAMRGVRYRSPGVRRRSIVGGVLALGVGVALVAGGLATPRASGQAGSVNFSATGDAFGSRMELTVSQAPLFPNLVDVGGPTAQVALDSLGSSRALAAHPWPGEVIVLLPGLAAGFGPQFPALVNNLPALIAGASPVPLPQELLDLFDEVDLPADELAPLFEDAPPLPPYPFAAMADGFDRPEDSVDLGVGSLDATAGRDEVTARAVLEPGGAGVGAAAATADSFVRVEDDRSVLVQAAGSMKGLQVGPLQIGVVSSVARMGMDTAGEVIREAEFNVSGIQLGALTLDLTADGLQLAGNDVPAPIADTVNETLAGSGIEMQLLEERITDTGVVTGGLQITYPVNFADLPIDALKGLGQGEVTVTFGQSIVTLTGAPIPPLPDIDLGAVSPPAVDTDSGFIPQPSGGGADLAAGDTGAVPSAPSRGSSSVETSPQDLVTSRGPGAENFDAMPIYLVVVGAALAMAGMGQLLRVAAFRPRAVEAI